MAFNGILYRKAGGTLELNRSVGGFCAVESAKLEDTWQEGGVVTLVVVTTEILTFYSGDYIVAKGNRYLVCKTISEYTTLDDGRYQYTVPLNSPDALFKNALMYNTTEVEDGGVYSWTRPNNFIMELGSVEVLVKTCCYNVNEVMGRRVFKLGTIDASVSDEYRVINFSDRNCWAGLKQTCEDFNTFYTIRVNTDETPDSDYIVDIGVEPGTFPETLMVGKRQGIAELTMSSQDEDVYTQFVVLGSTENLPAGYEHERLQLDTDLAGTPPVYDGSLIVVPEKYARWGRRRMELVFDHIKPSRTGTITGVPVDNIFAFYDTSLADIIAADPNWTPVGGTVHILDGNLMGYTFEIIGFHSGTQKITIKQISDSNGYVLPNDDSETFRFAEGMKYNFAGISLPDSYVVDAKTSLKAAAVEAMEYWTNPRGSFSLTPDPFFLRTNEVDISCGWLIPIKHDALEINKSIRVTSVTYDLLKDTYFDIDSVEVADITGKDNFMNSVHKSTQRSLNMLRDQGIINSPTAKDSNLTALLNRIALSLHLPNWDTLLEMLGNDKGLFTMINEEGEDIHVVNVDLLRAGTALVNSLFANEVFINGVEDTAGNLVNNYILVLTQPNIPVPADSEGTVIGEIPTSTAKIYHGIELDTGWYFSGDFTNCTGDVNSSTGLITISTITSESAEVEITATKTDKPTLTIVLPVLKINQGANGDPGDDSVVYYLTPSVDNVKRSIAGTNTPTTVTCAQYKIVGNATPVVGDKSLYYQISGGSETAYTEAVTVGTASYIDFILKDGATELWRTRVPVLQDIDGLITANGKVTLTPTPSVGGDGLYIGATHLGYYNGTNEEWATYMDNQGNFFLRGADTNDYLVWDASENKLTLTGEITAVGGSIGGITLATDKMYLGAGVHGGATTPFYVDDDGKFSLKNKLVFDGTDLTINGGGTFTGLLSVGGILIGKDAYDTDKHGIKLNEHNYWYLDGDNAKHKIGGADAYVSWDGTALTQVGGTITNGALVGTSINVPDATTPLFKVTSAGVLTAKSGTIGGLKIAATKTYLGEGNYGNSNTGFYVDTSAKFSLKDKLKFDGTNLTINGGGTFSGTLSAVNGEFNGLLDAGGIKIGLNAVSTGVGGLSIDANNYWDENGNFKAGSTGSYIQWDGTTFAIKGDITGSTGTFGGVFAGTIEVESTLKMGADAGGTGDFGIYIDSANYWLESGFSVGVGTSLLYLDGSTMKFSGELSAAGGIFAGRIEVGGDLKIGADVSGANDGIFINTNNYWYGTGALKIGDAYAYLSYNAGALTMVGGSITAGSFSTTDGTTSVTISPSAVGGAGVKVSKGDAFAQIGLSGSWPSVFVREGGTGTPSALLTPGQITVGDTAYATLTKAQLSLSGLVFNTTNLGTGSVGKSACGFLRAASSSKQNEDSTHTHQYVNGYLLSVVPSVPGSPDANTIYFVTGS